MPFIDLPQIRLHYITEGSGPPLVWLPGGNDCAALMLHAHRPLTARARITFLDPRGQGQSDTRVTAAEYTPAAYVGDLLGAMDALGIERAVVGGHSRGGRTSVEMALAHPDRVVAVIAAASPLLGATAPRRNGFRRYQTVLADKGVDAFLNLIGTGPRHPERRAIWVQAAHHAGAAALIAQYEALSRLPPLTERLADLRVPALFLSGDNDFLLDHARTAAAATPLARLAIIANARHAVFADNPTDYFAALNSFLDDVMAGEPVTPAAG
jgi:3-oxoadipate enol-lactonase